MAAFDYFATLLGAMGNVIDEKKRKKLEDDLKNLQMEAARLQQESARESITSSQEGRAQTRSDRTLEDYLAQLRAYEGGAPGVGVPPREQFFPEMASRLPNMVQYIPETGVVPSAAITDPRIRQRVQAEISGMAGRQQGYKESYKEYQEGKARLGRVEEREVERQGWAGEEAGRQAELHPIQKKTSESGLANIEDERTERKTTREEKEAIIRGKKAAVPGLEAVVDAALAEGSLDALSAAEAKADIGAWAAVATGDLSIPAARTITDRFNDEMTAIIRASIDPTTADQVNADILAMAKSALNITPSMSEKLRDLRAGMESMPDKYSEADIDLAMDHAVGADKAVASAESRAVDLKLQEAERYNAATSELRKQYESGAITPEQYAQGLQDAQVRLSAVLQDMATTVMTMGNRTASALRADAVSQERTRKAIRQEVADSEKRFEAIVKANAVLGVLYYDSKGRERVGGLGPEPQPSAKGYTSDKALVWKSQRDYTLQVITNFGSTLQNPAVKQDVLIGLALQYGFTPTEVLEKFGIDTNVGTQPTTQNMKSATTGGQVQSQAATSNRAAGALDTNNMTAVKQLLKQMGPEEIADWNARLDPKLPNIAYLRAAAEEALVWQLEQEQFKSQSVPAAPSPQSPGPIPRAAPPPGVQLQQTPQGVPGQKLDMPAQSTSMSGGIRQDQLATLTKSGASASVKRRILEKILGPGQDYEINRIMRGFSSELV